MPNNLLDSTRLYIEIEYLGKPENSNGRKTGEYYQSKSDALTRESFNAAKVVSVPLDVAFFIMDLKNSDNEIIETIGISKESYQALTGNIVYPEQYYVNKDNEFWQEAATK